MIDLQYLHLFMNIIDCIRLTYNVSIMFIFWYIANGTHAVPIGSSDNQENKYHLNEDNFKGFLVLEIVLRLPKKGLSWSWTHCNVSAYRRWRRQRNASKKMFGSFNLTTIHVNTGHLTLPVWGKNQTISIANHGLGLIEWWKSKSGREKRKRSWYTLLC